MATETRVNEWFSVENSPAWANSEIAAYRIWQRKTETEAYQRHEWKYRDGSTEMDEWIAAPRNVAWCVGSRIVSEKEAA
jgi:hypothetical protein